MEEVHGFSSHGEQNMQPFTGKIHKDVIFAET
jgi:hypothetical protein